MVTKAPRDDDGDAGIEVGRAPTLGCRCHRGPGHRHQVRRPDGRPAQPADAAQGQPAGRLRLPRLCLARSRRDQPGGVLRERREGGRRGGDAAPGGARVLRRPFARRTARRLRPLARAAGPAHHADVPRRGRHPLPAGVLGRRRSTSSRTPCGRSTTRTRPCSTRPGGRPTRPPSCTSCSRARLGPTTCRTARTCATSHPASRSPRPSASARARVTLDDIEHSDLILIAGPEPRNQPPAHAHQPRAAPSATAPRSLRSTRCFEAGLQRFKNPQRPKGIVGSGTSIADEYCQIRLGGDQAFFALLGKQLLAADRRPRRRPRPRVHRRAHRGFRGLRRRARCARRRRPAAHLRCPRDQVTQVARMVDGGAVGDRVLGDGTHPAPRRRRHDPRDRELPSAAGKLRSGRAPAPARCAATPTCRATARWGSTSCPPSPSSPRLDSEFGISSPRAPGHDTVEAIRAMRDGKVEVVHGHGWQLRPGDARLARHRRRAWATSTSPSRCPPS